MGLWLVLAGCASESGLSHLLDDGTDGPDGTVTDDPDDGGGRWGDLDPGNLPEIYFAVAWSSSAAVQCDDQYPCPNDVHYAVIDLRGQVISELDLPYPTTEMRHLAIAAAGPGQFTVAAEVWEDHPTDDEGFSANAWWETWRGDAVAGEIARTAHRDTEGVVVLDGAGSAVDLGTAASVHVGTWPGEPDRALWLLAGSGCGPGALEALRSVHLSDPGAPIEAWTAADLVPEGMEEALPFAFEASEDLDGEAAALVAFETGDCGFNAGYSAVSWSPETGVLWSADLGWDLAPREVTWAAFEGGAALSLFAGESPGWRLHSPGGTISGNVPPELIDAHPGPVLEPSTGTFVLRGRSAGTGRDALVFVHEGAVVWTIDELRFGLGSEAVYLRDVVLIPPVP